jgi:hypothetical protein
MLGATPKTVRIREFRRGRTSQIQHGASLHRFLQRFLSEGGKLWPWVKDMAKEVNLLDNLRTTVRTAARPASRSITCRITAGNRATT